MARRPRGATFAEIVRQVREAPAAVVVPVPLLRGPDGRAYFAIEEEEIDPDRALALVAAGALVAWDYCGGLGHGPCSPLDWFDARDRARMVAAGPPLLRDADAGRGHLVELCAPDGQALVLAMLDVRWGDLMYRR
ncbi:hypothetical protein JL107_10995 [Nakamurella flavida]|uniref:Uncharacterized protein n=1 Tax=Nakamurella flavida TaxID=363630 RepID=A0A938YPG6_9ACTN|nr:hypothetical protein [Nakamurella flavida]MBM9476974.1 hypothetical protein [Nakamurella flavida]MDP9779919.1 hypothetical protein [Nakamurella flavida]